MKGKPLSETHPELAAQAVGWDPSFVSAGTNKKRMWKCSLGHTWDATPNNRTALNRGCPYCSGRKVPAGFNDLATTNPELAAEADGWDPVTITAKLDSKKSWVCALGHQWESKVGHRSNGSGCPTCSGRLVLVGFNDFATTHPDIAAQAVGWDPKTVSAGSGLKKKFKCEFEHRWTTTILGRSSGRNCPSCAVGGYDPNKEGWLYFIKHDLWGLLQIGISNVPDQRLGAHKSSGWELLEVRGPMAGEVTYQWEQAILRSLLKRGVHLGQEDVAGKFSGYTEAWIQEDFPAKSLAELMQLVHEDESNRPRSV